MSGWGDMTREELQLRDIDELRIDIKSLLSKIYELQRSTLVQQEEAKHREENLKQQVEAKNIELAAKDAEIAELKRKQEIWADRWAAAKVLFNLPAAVNPNETSMEHDALDPSCEASKQESPASPDSY